VKKEWREQDEDREGHLNPKSCHCRGVNMNGPLGEYKEDLICIQKKK
jgi:hypothetical protein